MEISDPVEERRESMIDILASWDLDGALPGEAGMEVVREYVAGDLTLAQAIVKVREVTLPSGGVN